MRLSEALATCPELHLVEQDPAGVEAEWERILRRLEEAGLAVEPAEPGCAYFETRGIERLAGGVQAAVQRALDAVGSVWEPRVGVAERRFAALAAASVAPAGRALVVDDEETELFLAPLPLHLLPLGPERREELSELGVKRLGDLARLPEQRSPIGWARREAEAWRLANGEGDARVAARRPAAEIAEALEFPEPVANELTLARALSALLDRLLARDERGGRMPRRVAVSARLVGGGSWRRAVTLREPTAERDTAPAGARAETSRTARAGGRASPRAGGADGVRRDSGRARPPARQSTPEPSPRRAAAGTSGCRDRRCLHRRGGCAVVAHSRDQGDSRAARRLNEPRPVDVEALGGGAGGGRRGGGLVRARGMARGRPLVDRASRFGGATSTSSSRRARTSPSSTTTSGRGGFGRHRALHDPQGHAAFEVRPVRSSSVSLENGRSAWRARGAME